MEDRKLIELLEENMKIFHIRMNNLDECIKNKDFKNITREDIEAKTQARKDVGLMATLVLKKVNEINENTSLDNCCKHELIKQLIFIYNSNSY